MTLYTVHRKDIPLDGRHVAYLAVQSSTGLQQFTTAKWLFIEQGGVWAQPIVSLQSDDTVDNYLAAARYLVDQGYTAPSRLAIGSPTGEGPSIVSSCIAKAPYLFAVALVTGKRTGTTPTTCTNLVGQAAKAATPTTAQVYGVATPFYQLQAKKSYPATWVMAAAAPEATALPHAAKLVAQLQYLQPSGRPILLYTPANACRATVDYWSFVWYYTQLQKTTPA